MPCLLFCGFRYKSSGASKCVGALLFLGLDIDGARVIPCCVLCELIQPLLATVNQLADRTLRSLQLFMEVSDLLLRIFRVIANAIARLHSVDENVRRRGSRRSHVQRVVSLTQASHGTVEAIEFCALCRESRCTTNFDRHF